ncbi:transposase [Streptomyces sp. NPDC050704]|uniref:transposase n=1 Tax=Streptomyces sp. NPDC050704 TaxID=3157219 RepID=UPI0034238E0A
MPDQLSSISVLASTAVTPGCGCYVYRFGSIAPGLRAGCCPSDITDAEWAEVRSAMPVPAWLLKRGGRPEAYCHRGILDAVRYLVDNGVKWTALPVDFPYWRAVYDFFRRWRSYDYVRELYERLRRSARERSGRNAEPSAAIIDSQSVDASETGCDVVQRALAQILGRSCGESPQCSIAEVRVRVRPHTSSSSTAFDGSITSRGVP